MNEQVLQLIQTGKIPYRYEADPKTGLYFGLLVLVVVVVFAFAQSITRRLVGA